MNQCDNAGVVNHDTGVSTSVDRLLRVVAFPGQSGALFYIDGSPVYRYSGALEDSFYATIAYLGCMLQDRAGTSAFGAKVRVNSMVARHTMARNDPRLDPQTITLTGDVTGSGTGSFAATIANDAVTYAKMQNVTATDRILGRSTAGAGDVEEIICTAFARGVLDDADAATARTTLGLGSANTPTFEALILKSGDEIRNDTDGRLDFLPKPNSVDQVGITFNTVQRSNIVSVGTLRTSNGVLNDGSVQWDAKQIIGNNVDLVVSGQDWSALRQVVGAGLKQTLALGVSANFDFGGTDISSGSVAIMHRFHMGQANRTPSTTHVDPHLYIYSQDNSQANDFMRFSHDQTNGVIESGNGKLVAKAATRVRIVGSAGGFDLPTGDGTIGQVLTTNGSGDVSWATPSGGGGGISIDEAKRVAYIGI
jgi:hypothetical protein